MSVRAGATGARGATGATGSGSRPQALNSMTTRTAARRISGFSHDCARMRGKLIRGINYPWTVFDGRANYGCDFGRNKWNSHTGVSAHAQDVRDDFAAMSG